MSQGIVMECVRILVLLVTIVTSACSAQPHDEPVDPGAQTGNPDHQGGHTPNDSAMQSIASRIAVPPGYERVAVAPGSFGAWLRELPVRPGRPPVYLYNGDEKSNQAAHFAVLDMDVGDRDLQQCADAVIRLRAEYLYQGPCKDEIQFDFTSGDVARWTDWRDGLRPIVSETRVTWRQTAAADSGYANFRAYLETVFMYAGSASLERELIAVTETEAMKIGDVFIQGGFPGHAVLVVDVAENGAGELAFLLAQSYMPAQDIHVLRSSSDIEPWYRLKSAGDLPTPEWDFRFDDLRRFPYTGCEADADGTGSVDFDGLRSGGSR